jgi:hypothetical protein
MPKVSEKTKTKTIVLKTKDLYKETIKFIRKYCYPVKDDKNKHLLEKFSRFIAQNLIDEIIGNLELDDDEKLDISDESSLNEYMNAFIVSTIYLPEYATELYGYPGEFDKIIKEKGLHLKYKEIWNHCITKKYVKARKNEIFENEDFDSDSE